MEGLYIILLAAGTLSWGTNSLEYTREYRQIDNPNNVCMVGVQHRYVDLLGEMLYFYNINTKEVIKVLVVDVQEEKYVGTEHEMEHVGLLADISCRRMVYQHGFLFKISNRAHGHHPNSLSFALDSNVVARVNRRLRSPHYICSGDPRDHCTRQIEAWIENGQ